MLKKISIRSGRDPFSVMRRAQKLIHLTHIKFKHLHRGFEQIQPLLEPPLASIILGEHLRWPRFKGGDVGGV